MFGLTPARINTQPVLYNLSCQDTEWAPGAARGRASGTQAGLSELLELEITGMLSTNTRWLEQVLEQVLEQGWQL